MKIKSICIVGGGTSGFMSAAMLSALNKKNNYGWEIKIVHSPEIGPIGVGESTIQGVREAHKFIGLQDREWMWDANATYKNGIKFQDFLEKGISWSYPFGPISETKETIDQWPFLRKTYPETFKPDNAYLWLNPSGIFMDENKISIDIQQYLDRFTSYHFDASLYHKSLARVAKNNGVEIIEDKLNKTSFKEDGSVDSIYCERGEYKADLFIDCTGFKSLLLEQAMGSKFVSYNDTLINNKAYKAFIPWTEEQQKKIPTYTNCVALKNGWCWEIPLWNGMSYGYVHSNRFADPIEIEDEFHLHVGEVNRNTINFVSGRHERGWNKNVVAIGLSYGFVEPLESNGIASTIKLLWNLIEALEVKDGFINQVTRDCFDMKAALILDGFKVWIQNHYSFSKRDDSKYWEYLTQSDIYRNTWGQETCYQEISNPNGFSLREDQDGLISLSYGMDVFPYHFSDLKYQGLFSDKCESNFLNSIEALKEQAKRSPTHYEYLIKNIYGDQK